MMKSYDLKPTKENILATLKNDKIRRRTYLINLLKFLDNLDTNITISIDGAWGSGKTFFIKQVIYVLLNTNIFIDNEDIKINRKELEKVLGKEIVYDRTYLPVYYNAWKNDNSMDPLLSVIKEVINSYSSSTKFSGNADVKKGIKETIKDIVSAVEVNIPLPNKENPANPGYINISGENLSNVIDSLENFKKKNYLEQIEEQDILQEKINELFKTLCVEKGDRFVVFIDELDRCKPTFAINLLERIKHYFDNEKIIFVFSTNIIELQHTVKKYYGNNFDAENYLDKFFNYRFQLPSVNTEQYIDFIGEIMTTNYVSDQILFIIKHFKLSMRNINHYFQTYNVVSSLFERQTDVLNDYGSKFCSDCIIPILVYLYLFEKERYKNFLIGKEEQFFAQLMLAKKEDVYIKDFITFTNNHIGAESNELGTLKAIYNMIFSEENFNNFYTKVLSKKYIFIPGIKNKIESSMSCFIDV